MKTSPVTFLRRVSLCEGVSFLLLLGVAMPLKRYADMPMAVTVVGWAHGVLFILLGMALVQTWMAKSWPVGRLALVFAASLIPFAPFFLDKRMRQWERE